MNPFGGDAKRDRERREKALSNPIRRRIVELFTTDESRSLAAAAVTDDLRRFANVSVRQVAYHLACLRDAQLIPAENAEGR